MLILIFSLREVINVTRYNDSLNSYCVGYVIGNAAVLMGALFILYRINRQRLS